MGYKYMLDKTFADRLNDACTKAGIPVRGRAKYIQDRLSDKLSITAIRKWLVGEAMPETKRIGELAVIANTSVEALFADEINSSKDRIAQDITSNYGPSARRFEVPILSWVQAGAFCNSESQVLPQDCETILCPNRSASRSTFALRVVGDSMTAPYGKSYPEGTIIYVDPEKEALPRNRVVARTELGFTFKELAINELGERYLRALNPHHQPIFGEGIEICGVVIGSYSPEPA